MKKIKLFYLENCPYCKKSINDMNQLLKENTSFKDIEVQMIEESKDSVIANSYDYYYVPTFYVNDVKLAEGKITKDEINKILMEALS